MFLIVYFSPATVSDSDTDTCSGSWRAVGEALPNGAVMNHPGGNRLWAPDIHYGQDKGYRMYYAISTLGSRYNAINGNWVETDGASYLSFGLSALPSTRDGSYNAMGHHHRSDKSCLESSGTILLAFHGRIYGPGGQGVLKDKQHRLVFYYHYADKGYRALDSSISIRWNVLRWEGGWSVL
ncbi:hypothetical protein BDW72DRAFT_205415 [Aspergillus terricola var. indicus]